jgi:cytochrome P450
MPAMDDTPGPTAPNPPFVAASSTPPELDIAGYLHDPDAELHRCAALHWYAKGIDEQGRELPIVLDFDGARQVLRDRRLSTRSFTEDMVAAGLSERTAYQLTPLFRRDGALHREFRGLLSAAFTPRSVERLRPLAAAVAARLADDIVAGGGSCEFVAEFAAPLPPEVFATLFGLPVEERDRLARWGAVVTDAFVPALIAERAPAIEAAAAEMREWSLELIAARRARPADDLITGLLHAELDAQQFDDEDITDIISGFVFAGSETTKRQLTRAIEAFAEHPDDWERLAAHPDLVDGAVEEVLRSYSIIPGLSRVAAEEFDHQDLTLAPGQKVAATFVTANADPATFADPERFDITRANAKEHLSFGWGPHFCMGAGLARVELQEALRALVTRLGPPSVTPSSAPAEALAFGSPDELHVRFAPRA